MRRLRGKRTSLKEAKLPSENGLVLVSRTEAAIQSTIPQQACFLITRRSCFLKFDVLQSIRIISERKVITFVFKSYAKCCYYYFYVFAFPKAQLWQDQLRVTNKREKRLSKEICD